MSRSVLLTGATGFVGSHLARRLLAQGCAVHAVVRSADAVVPPGVQAHVHDGSTAGMIALMGAAAPQQVVHLASMVLVQHQAEDLAPLLQSNIVFGTQLAEAMAHHGVRQLVNTGTSWQYFHSEQYRPVCLYAATKQAYEALLRFYCDSAGLQVISLLLFDTYGAGDPRPKLLNLLSRAQQAGQPLAMSPGAQEIDLVHVDDVVAAYLVALERLAQGQVQGMEHYGISSGQPLALRELASLFAAASGQPLAIDWGGRAYREREVMLAWRNYPRLPGWAPRISLADGLAALLHPQR
jgi:nucleoside-diphosphate-sugar epimerase